MTFAFSSAGRKSPCVVFSGPSPTPPRRSVAVFAAAFVLVVASSVRPIIAIAVALIVGGRERLHAGNGTQTNVGDGNPRGDPKTNPMEAHPWRKGFYPMHGVEEEQDARIQAMSSRRQDATKRLLLHEAIGKARFHILRSKMSPYRDQQQMEQLSLGRDFPYTLKRFQSIQVWVRVFPIGFGKLSNCVEYLTGWMRIIWFKALFPSQEISRK